MLHSRANSLGSLSALTELTDTLSDLSSLTALTPSEVDSHASTETYMVIQSDDSFRDILNRPISVVVGDAQRIINDKFMDSTHRMYTYGRSGGNNPKMDLAKVILAILECAQECGGEDGKKYVASVIVRCNMEVDSTKTIADAAVTWLTHFLFPFKASGGQLRQAHKGERSELATPTYEDTYGILGPGVGSNAPPSLRTQILLRENYRCVITGKQDGTNPNLDMRIFTTQLSTSHILHRAIANYDSNKDSPSFKSASITFDILRNFSRLPESTFADLKKHIDSPKNAILLEPNSHWGFDQYIWCFKPTETPNVYTTKTYGEMVHALSEQQVTVTFRDKSGDMPDSEPKNIPLPDPHYISLHAAIAGILHMSGAGKFFDELLERYRDDTSGVDPIRCWDDLEDRSQIELLRESVASIAVK